MEHKKKSNFFIKFLLFAAIIIGAGAYAYYFPKTMELIDKEVVKIFEKCGKEIEFTLFSDFSSFAGKTVNQIGYYLEIIENNLNEKDFDTSPLPVFVFTNSAFFPAEEKNITSCYGSRKDPFTGTEENHNGIDIAAETGSGIFAAWPGKIVESGFSEIYGNYILIEHSKGFLTKYCHLSKILCEKEDFVKACEKIGEAGSTGRSTGSHLHFEVIVDGRYVDPKVCFAV